MTRTALSILVVVLAITAIVLPAWNRRQIGHNTDLLHAMRACIYNPDYRGVTTEDQRQLFVQCLDDYRMAGK